VTPRFVLFDLDNTVYPYDPCHRSGLALAQAAAAALDSAWADPAAFRAGYDRARRAVKARVGKAAASSHCRLLYFKQQVEERSGRSDLAASLLLHDAYWKGYFARMRPDPGCAPLFAELRRRQVRTAWVSNFTTERQVKKLRAMRLSRAADLLVTSEEAGAEKPDPAVIDLALARLGADPAATWMVGDDPADDFPPAAARGLGTVWFRRGESPALPAGYAGPPPLHVVGSWPELARLLLGG
jgi:HAD superfamily hydrolase (TIGR01549 family)